MLRITFYLLLAVVTYLSMRSRVQGIDIQVNDKVGHALAYFVLMLNGGLAYGKDRYRKLALGLFLFGLLIEIIQGLVPGRTSSLFDLVANSSGIVFGLSILFIFGESILFQLKRLGWSK
jgi:VanZ family protein